jgi:hypothetical protein
MKNHFVQKCLLAVAGLALSSTSFAAGLPKLAAHPQPDVNAALRQQKQDFLKTLSPTPDATTVCSFTFTSGANNNSLEYCVTANGNVSEFQTPIGHTLVSAEDRAEGYGICDVTNGDPQGNGRVAYIDFAEFGDSGNWNPPVVLSHNGTTVKIARTTIDGIWTLTQTFTQEASTASVKIGMTLKNNTAIQREAFLVRYADVDADGFFQNNFDGTFSNAFGWNSISSEAASPVGLLLQNLGTLDPTQIGSEGFAQDTFLPPPACNPGANFVPAPLVGIDGSVVLIYDMHVPQKKSLSVTLGYKGL